MHLPHPPGFAPDLNNLKLKCSHCWLHCSFAVDLRMYSRPIIIKRKPTAPVCSLSTLVCLDLLRYLDHSTGHGYSVAYLHTASWG